MVLNDNMELNKRAKEVFYLHQAIYTGEGLSRRELRILKNRGLVECHITGGGGVPMKLMWKAAEKLWI
jgi:hypothetical protein